MAIAEAGSEGQFTTWRPGTFTEANDVLRALDQHGPNVVVDLSAYQPHDTGDLGALVDGLRQFQADGGRAVFMCPTAGTRLLLRSTGIDRNVPVVTDMASARLTFTDQSTGR